MLGSIWERRRTKAAATAIAGVALLAALAAPTPASAASADENLLLTLTNTVRASVGVPGLTLDSTLSNIARQWSQVMAGQNNISHNPNYKSQVEANGFDNWVKTGENVGMGPTVQAIQNALVASPGHYRNMTDGDFTKVGIGIVFANNTFWITVDFLALDGSPAPAPAPAPVVTSPPKTAPPAPVTTTPPPPPPTTTTAPPPPPTTTTTVPPTTTTTVAPPPPSSLPMQLALMVQQVRALGTHK